MSAELFDISGRTAVVTGGSRGLGLMIAEGLCAAGVRVIISARKAAACEEAAAHLAGHGDAVAAPADVATADGVAAVAAAVAERFDDRLDLLVNNAGTYWSAPIDDHPEAAWDKLYEVNLKAVFQLTTALLPALRNAAGPDHPARIINIGSSDGAAVPAYVPGAEYTENYAYSATKAGVHMLTRHLAQRLAREHVNVNAIAPGPFDSKMTAPVLGDPVLRAQLADGVPMGRIGRPSDIAGAVQYLASAASSYVTGVILPVDGGLLGCR